MAAPILMLDVTPTGRGRGICTEARLEADFTRVGAAKTPDAKTMGRWE
jgi:hypothetical protein